MISKDWKRQLSELAYSHGIRDHQIVVNCSNKLMIVADDLSHGVFAQSNPTDLTRARFDVERQLVAFKKEPGTG